MLYQHYMKLFCKVKKNVMWFLLNYLIVDEEGCRMFSYIWRWDLLDKALTMKIFKMTLVTLKEAICKKVRTISLQSIVVAEVFKASSTL